MRSQVSLTGLLFGALLMLPSAVQAHVVPGSTHTIFSGLAHPLLGFDHLAAIIGVGLLGAQLGGRSLWLLPTVFAGIMSFGAAFGTAGTGLPLVEPMILLSLFVLGSLILSARSAGFAGTAALVGVFALFHGHAHGTEIGLAGGWAYLPGMMVSTAALLGCGIMLGLAARATARDHWIRFAGGGIAASGVALMFGLL